MEAAPKNAARRSKERRNYAANGFERCAISE